MIYNYLKGFVLYCPKVYRKTSEKEVNVNIVSFLFPRRNFVVKMISTYTQKATVTGLSLGGLWSFQHIISPDEEAPTVTYKVNITFYPSHIFKYKTGQNTLVIHYHKYYHYLVQNCFKKACVHLKSETKITFTFYIPTWEELSNNLSH